MRSVQTGDFWVNTDHGRLFAKRWESTSAPASDTAPLILFHDSLGCVELWRDFPERLVLATGRSVVAYDRLGFGRSDAHPSTLDSDFVRDEARVAFRVLRDAWGSSASSRSDTALAAAWLSRVRPPIRPTAAR